MQKLTDQEIFTKVYHHLLTQREKAVTNPLDEYLDCRYRGSNGLKCAIGCLISDELYKSEMETLPIFKLMRTFQDLPFGSWNNLTLLIRLQGIHDQNPVDTWKTRLRDVADVYNLEVPTCP